jgi:hypothetical protein
LGYGGFLPLSPQLCFAVCGIVVRGCVGGKAGVWMGGKGVGETRRYVTCCESSAPTLVSSNVTLEVSTTVTTHPRPKDFLSIFFLPIPNIANAFPCPRKKDMLTTW